MPHAHADTPDSITVLSKGGVTEWKCLVPAEIPFDQEAELSARGKSHRSRERFQAIVSDTTWLLNQVTPGKRSHPGTESELIKMTRITTQTTITRREFTAQAQRAYALYRLHQFPSSIRDYDACIRMEPTFALLYYNRACVHYACHKKENAVLDLTRAVKLDCRSMLFVESRALILKELGRFREAIQDYSWLETLRRGHTNLSHPRQSLRDQEGLYSGERSEDIAAISGNIEISNGDAAVSIQGLPTLLLSGRSSQVNISRTNCQTSSRHSHHDTPEESENETMKSMILRLLEHPSHMRAPEDIRHAIELVRHWTFFRGMTQRMIQQCLVEAVYVRYDAETMVVEQGTCSDKILVVLNPTATFVKGIECHGVSKLREIQKVSQGDVVGYDAYTVSFATGVLSTLTHLVTNITVSATEHAPLRPSPSNSQDSSTRPLANNSLLSPEPASFKAMTTVHCLALDHALYREILHQHECIVLEERVQFLRGCRVFHGLSDEVLTAIAAAATALVYDPGKDILAAGKPVEQLYLIQRGVCRVRKSIHFPSAKVEKNTPIGNGVWVLDNGRRLTNNVQRTQNHSQLNTHVVDIGVLASGQVFGELCVLHPGHLSPVTIHAESMVKVLILDQEILTRLHVQYNSGIMNALQASLRFHNPPEQKIIQLQKDGALWQQEKHRVLQELIRDKKSKNVIKNTNQLPHLLNRRISTLEPISPVIAKVKKVSTLTYSTSAIF